MKEMFFCGASSAKAWKSAMLMTVLWKKEILSVHLLVSFAIPSRVLNRKGNNKTIKKTHPTIEVCF